MFKLEFETDNAAFADGPYEIQRILKKIAQQIETSEGNAIVDYNGNKVGEWSLDDD